MSPYSSSQKSEGSSILLSQAVSGAFFLSLLQIFSRLFTFTLNSILIRLTSPETLGFVSIQLELLLSTILFISREGVRLALIRGDDHKDRKNESNPNENIPDNIEEIPRDQSNPLSSDHGYSLRHRNKNSSSKSSHESTLSHPSIDKIPNQSIINLLYLPHVVSVPIITCVAIIYFSYPPNPYPPNYNLCISLYLWSAILELAIEPFYILAQRNLNFAIRVRVEGTAIVVKGVSILILTVLFEHGFFLGGTAGQKNIGLAYCWGQLIYASCLVIGYSLDWSKSGVGFRSILPRRLSTSDINGYSF